MPTTQARDRNIGHRLIVRCNPSSETPGCLPFLPRHIQRPNHTVSTIEDENRRQSLRCSVCSSQFDSQHSPRGLAVASNLYRVPQSSPSDVARLSSTPITSRQQLTEVIYADYADFISTNLEYITQVNEIAPTALGDWFLCVNVDKTEPTIISCETGRDEWRTTKKLGSLLGNVEDLSRRKMLVVTAFRCTWSIWLRTQHVSEQIRLRLYNASVRPVLL